MIGSVWEQVRHNIDHATEATIWMNIFLNNKFHVEETPQVIRLHSWATELVKKHRGESHFLQQMGFFFTAKHSTHEQEFHIDYHPEAETFFIPLVPISTLNSIRYMTSYSTSTPTAGKYNLNRYGKDDFDLREQLNVPTPCDWFNLPKPVIDRMRKTVTTPLGFAIEAPPRSVLNEPNSPKALPLRPSSGVFVMMETTPPIASVPQRVDCGPFRTSIRSIFSVSRREKSKPPPTVLVSLTGMPSIRTSV